MAQETDAAAGPGELVLGVAHGGVTRNARRGAPCGDRYRIHFVFGERVKHILVALFITCPLASQRLLRRLQDLYVDLQLRELLLHLVLKLLGLTNHIENLSVAL